MGEQRESIQPDADAPVDDVEGHVLVGDGDVEPEDAVEGHALVESS